MSTTPGPSAVEPPAVPYGPPVTSGPGSATEPVVAPVSRKRQVGTFALGALFEIALRTVLPIVLKAIFRAFSR